MRTVTIMAAALAVVLAMAAPSTASPITRKMVCSAGGAMTVTVQQGQGLAGKGVKLLIAFQKGQNPNHLNPGECAWQDGALSRLDPSSMSFMAPQTSVDFVLTGGSSVANLTVNSSTDQMRFSVDSLLHNILQSHGLVVDAYEQGSQIVISRVYY